MSPFASFIPALLAAQVVGGAPLAGQPRPQITAVRVEIPPVLDGRLDDPAWQAAVSTSDFVQHFPDEGAAPLETTTLRVLYDDHAVYFGIDCQQRSPVEAKLTRRDRFVEADRVLVDLDSRADGVSAAHFEVNAAGVLMDGVYFNDTAYSADWDEAWDARTAITSTGWSVEIRIPLRVLRFYPARTVPWGLQVRRYISARQELDEWVFMPRASAGYVSLFGRLEGIKDLPTGGRLELSPFVVGSLRRRDAGAIAGATAHGWDAKVAIGGDARLRITPAMTLDVAVLPDFGQVEADQVTLNLSTSEIYYPEKRRFFLDGIEAFNTPLSVLYTRRIGRQPAVPTLGSDEVLVEAPEPSPIYAAAKLLGSLGRNYRLGVLSAVTGRNDVTVSDDQGVTTRPRLAEPLSSFNVLRLRRQVGGNGAVGLLATATNRFEPSGAEPGGTVDAGTMPVGGRSWNDAYVGGLDGRWRSPDSLYSASGQVVGSLLVGGPARDEPDGHPIRPGHPDLGAIANVGKDGGEHWLAHLNGSYSGRQFELNDLGYLGRKGDWAVGGDLTLRTLSGWWRTLESSAAVVARYQGSLDGVRLASFVQLQGWARFSDFSSVWLAVGCRQSYFDDREVGDGTALEHHARAGFMTSWSSDPRRGLVVRVWAQVWGFSGGYYGDSWIQLLLRPLPRLELDVQPTVMLTDGEPRYLSNADSFVLGQLRARSLGLTLRASYTFTPRLTLQTYAQPFVAADHYHDFSTFAADRVGPGATIPLAGLIEGPGDGSDHDSKTATLNLNVVLRWEYRLGSTIFLVYTRSQNPSVATQPPGFDFHPLFRAHPAVDVFMAKMSYAWD